MVSGSSLAAYVVADGLRGSVAHEATRPYLMSSHAMRSVRRHAKRREQEKKIESLEKELNSWWIWWLLGTNHTHSDIDNEVLVRVRAIEPGIRAQVAESAQGQPRHSARSLVDCETQPYSNAAKHYFPEKPFSTVSLSEIRHNQRARNLPPDVAAAFDPWWMLDAMAACPPVVHNAGATLVRGLQEDIEKVEGQSLLNVMHEKLHLHDLSVEQTKRTIDQAKHLPPHVFSEGDVVYSGMEKCAYIIKRVGYGEYLQEVRIIKVGEANTYEAGSWIRHTHLFLLEPGDALEVTQDITDATDDYQGFDQDGDVCIALDSRIGARSATTIFFSDLRHLTLI